MSYLSYNKEQIKGTVFLFNQCLKDEMKALKLVIFGLNVFKLELFTENSVHFEHIFNPIDWYNPIVVNTIFQFTLGWYQPLTASLGNLCNTIKVKCV